MPRATSARRTETIDTASCKSDATAARASSARGSSLRVRLRDGMAPRPRDCDFCQYRSLCRVETHDGLLDEHGEPQ